ncbi:facilitated trehalose transporter tret1-2 -like protein [Holotrichia oblita]|uniref:Facilitated trehalose transporter tret1-2 -like protein n=1 Tax=Holotrichia oblita TaxID=644536 RepID=A0ACB9TQ10_HOLOL|nr:facilitated trehalose transporter tret1-2 -like protein [Holotrichia oblita]
MAIIAEKPIKSQDKSRQLPQVLALCSASIAAFASGNLFSFASPAIPKLTAEDYNFTIEQASYLTVIPPLAMIVSSPIFCLLIDKIGRKRTLLLSGLFHIASWLCVAFTKNIAVFYVSRIFSGLSDANVFSALPTYIAEVTTPKVRSLYGNALVLFMFCGQFSVNVVGFYLSIPNTAFVLITFPLLFLITFIFMPETPYYLIMIGDDQSAEKSLQRLRGMDDVQKEVTQLKSDVERQLSERGHFKDLFLIPSNRKALAIANLARAFQQLGVSIAGLATGSLFAFPSPAIPKLITDDYNFTMEEASYLTVIPAIAMIFASPIFCMLIDKIGRKRTLLLSGLCHISAWLFVAFARTIYLFYVSRIFAGLADSIVFAVVPTYIAEVTTPKVRSLYGNALVLALFTGQFTTNCVGFYFSVKMTAFILLALPLAFLSTFIFMPETPYYLVMIEDQISAEKSLQRLRGTEDVQDELKQLNADVRRQLSETGYLKDLFIIASNRKALLIANLARIIQQLAGISALIQYSQYMFMQAGGDISSGHAAMIFSGILALVNVFINILTDRFGRKRSMILSCSGSGLVLLALTIYFYLQIYTEVNLSQVNWFPVFAIVAYVLIFSLGLGAVPTLMTGEVFSASIRKHGVMVTNVVFAILLCTITKLFQFLMSVYGLCVPFLFFSICCFIGAVLSYFIIPETKGKTLEQIQQDLKASLSGLSSATLFAFPSPAIPKLLGEDYNFTIEEASYLPVISALTMIVTSPIFCTATDKIGRKRTLLMSGCFHIIAWLFVAFSKTVWLFYVSRFFAGLADTVLYAAIPTYIAEITTPKIRSLYGNSVLLFIFCGQLLSNSVGFYLTIPMTAFVLLICPILFLITFMLMPESPYYLMMIGNEISAEKSLQKLRGLDNVQDELKQINADVKRQLSETGYFKDLWLNASNRKAMIIANLARAFQQLSGMTALMQYTQYIFLQAGGDISSGAASMIFAGMLVFVNIFIGVVSDKFGRKRSMIVSCIGCFLVLVPLAAYFYLQTNTEVDLSRISWIPLLAIIIYVFLYSLGLGFVPTIMIGEIFSASIKKYAVMVSNMIFAFYMCTITKLFQVLMSAYGLWVPFLFFGICCLVGGVSSYFIIPETKGKTLEQIQQELKGNKQKN